MRKPIDKDMQQKIALGVIMYIIGFVMFNNMVVTKIDKKIKAEKQKVELAKFQHSEALIKASNIKLIKENYEKEKARYTEKSKQFINEKEKKIILKKIEEVGKKHGIKLETIALTKAEPSSGEKKNGVAAKNIVAPNPNEITYKEYRIVMTFKSNYSDLTEYINEIEHLEKLVLVQQMDLTSDGKEISAKVLLKCYLFENGGV